MKKKWNKIVEEILKMDSDMSKLSDSELRHKTDEFKLRLKEGTSLDSLLPEAFAVVREAAFRVVGMKPYPVQIMGGIAIHEGNIAEMATGEGKTLVSTMPAYLNALVGKGVHIVTVNDYLAKRDAEWMGKIHEFLGLSVGYILNDYTPDRRKQAYNCDITYITNNELGFDGTYLFVFLVEKICTSSGIALTYGEFIGQEKYSIFLTMITFLISIPYILSFLLRMIKKFIQVVTGNKSVALIFKPVEALISINVLRYAIYILLFFTSVFTYSVNVSQSDYVFSLVKEALLEFVLLDTVIYSIITNIRDTKKNHKQQNMRRYYVPFKYDLEFVLSAITMHNLKDKEMYARIKFSVDINKILKEKKQNDVSEIDKLLAEISTNYYKTEILEQKTKVVLSRIIDLIG